MARKQWTVRGCRAGGDQAILEHTLGDRNLNSWRKMMVAAQEPKRGKWSVASAPLEVTRDKSSKSSQNSPE